jgi:hypothetical protein
LFSRSGLSEALPNSETGLLHYARAEPDVKRNETILRIVVSV